MNSTEAIDFLHSLITRVETCYSDGDSLLNIPKDKRCEPDSRGIGCIFLDRMKQYKNRICQIDAETGKTQTYEELLVRSVRVARELRTRGITPDDIVSICTTNHLDTCVPFIACMLIGVKVSSLDPTLPLADCKYLLSLVKPKIIFIGEESIKLIETSLAANDLDTEIVVFGSTSNHSSFDEFVQENDEDEWNFEAVPVENIYDTAVIFFSSGTTGLPKGIMSPHYGLLYQNIYFALERNLGVILSFTSLYWISGVMILIMSILYGSTRVLGRFHPMTMMKYVEQYKVTMSFVAPIFTHMLTQTPGSCDFDTSSLSELFIGGGPIGEEQLLRLRKLLPHSQICNIYGMTEASGCLSFFRTVDVDLMLNKPKSCGRPVSGLKYRVVDPDTGRILGPNKQGELRVKGDLLMNGYYNRPEESTKVWDKEGYMHTGDVVYYDEEYCFYVVDRIKDLLKYQSWHVAPAEIESVLLTHPAIKETVVFGMPHEVDGDLPMAAVVLRPGKTGSVTEKDIVKFVNDRVSERKKLRAGVVFIEKIPLTPTGKLRRRDVRDLILKNRNL